MALELSEIPRISFSHYLGHFDVERRPSKANSALNSSIDFDFRVRQSFELQESSSADELFAGGKILPTEIKKKKKKQTDDQYSSSAISPPPILPPSSSSVHEEANMKENPKKEIRRNDEKQSCKWFWSFKKGLNCGSGGRYNTTFILPLLLGCNSSIDSAPNLKQASISISKDYHSQSQNSSYKSNSTILWHHKPPLRKSTSKPYGNGTAHVNLVFTNLFGLASIFFNGKDKNHKKK